jgi:hypothetical protein
VANGAGYISELTVLGPGLLTVNSEVQEATQKFGEYIPKGTTSKETVETRSYCKKLFMVKFPELLVSPSYSKCQLPHIYIYIFYLLMMGC